MLQYPADRPAGADFVTFGHTKYSSRGQGQGAGGITLYMPEKTPAVPNPQSWSSSHSYFAGPLGQVKRDVIETMADVATNAGNPNAEAPGSIGRAMERFKNIRNSAGPAGRQFALERMGGFMNLSANQILSVTRGEIYNPNVELIYDAPQLRMFTFMYSFAPKSRGEASAALSIIKEFKAYSSPAEKGGGKLEIPHVWHIKYSNSKYNKFKPAACMNVNVDYNGALDEYMTFEDGSPIQISMSLQFKEVEIVLRKDHESSQSGF